MLHFHVNLINSLLKVHLIWNVRTGKRWQDWKTNILLGSYWLRLLPWFQKVLLLLPSCDGGVFHLQHWMQHFRVESTTRIWNYFCVLSFCLSNCIKGLYMPSFILFPPIISMFVVTCAITVSVVDFLVHYHFWSNFIFAKLRSRSHLHFRWEETSFDIRQIIWVWSWLLL